MTVSACFLISYAWSDDLTKGGGRGFACTWHIRPDGTAPKPQDIIDALADAASLISEKAHAVPISVSRVADVTDAEVRAAAKVVTE